MPAHNGKADPSPGVGFSSPFVSRTKEPPFGMELPSSRYSNSQLRDQNTNSPRMSTMITRPPYSSQMLPAAREVDQEERKTGMHSTHPRSRQDGWSSHLPVRDALPIREPPPSTMAFDPVRGYGTEAYSHSATSSINISSPTSSKRRRSSYEEDQDYESRGRGVPRMNSESSRPSLQSRSSFGPPAYFNQQVVLGSENWPASNRATPYQHALALPLTNSPRSDLRPPPLAPPEPRPTLPHQDSPSNSRPASGFGRILSNPASPAAGSNSPPRLEIRPTLPSLPDIFPGLARTGAFSSTPTPQPGRSTDTEYSWSSPRVIPQSCNQFPPASSDPPILAYQPPPIYQQPRGQSYSGPSSTPHDRTPFTNNPYNIYPANSFPFSHEAGEGGNDGKPRKRRGNLPKDTTDKLRSWFISHLNHPYPTEDEKQELMRKTGLAMNQISNWFINARRRQLPALVNNANAEMHARMKRDAAVNGDNVSDFGDNRRRSSPNIALGDSDAEGSVYQDEYDPTVRHRDSI